MVESAASQQTQPDCPGDNCLQIQDITSYSSSDLTDYPVLCYTPKQCSNSQQNGNNKCPLYVWIDGTSHNDIMEIPDKYFLREMVGRGFVSCVALYDDSPLSYAMEGCDGFRQKAYDIFGTTSSKNSLIDQVCGIHADCTRGVAVHGWSQGAHIATLASEFVTVTAALLFGNGNRNTVSFLVDMDVSCMNAINIDPRLAPTRRRSIVGEEDFFFNQSS
jgi:hypothetical protein